MNGAPPQPGGILHGTFQNGSNPFGVSNQFGHIQQTLQLPQQPQQQFCFPPAGGMMQNQPTAFNEMVIEPDVCMQDYDPGFSPSSLDDSELQQVAEQLDEMDGAACVSQSSQGMDVDSNSNSIQHSRKRKQPEWVNADDPMSGVESRIKRLKLPTSSPVEFARITVITITGRKVSIEVEVDDLVLKLKEQLEHVAGIPSSQQRLLVRGRVMADLNELRNYGIQNGSVVYMVSQLVGGY